MRTMLPPCVRKAIENLNDNKCALIVAAYFKSYAHTPGDILEAVPPEYVPKIWQLYKDNMTPNFSCQLVGQYCPDNCDSQHCPLVMNDDPVEFLVSRVTKAIYDLETKTMTLWFDGVSVPLTINVKDAFKNPSEPRSEISVFTLEHFGTPVWLGKEKLRDDSGRITGWRDLLVEFITRVYAISKKVSGNDSEGIGELLLDLVQNHDVTPAELATVESKVFVYINKYGETYLAVEPRLFRMKARNYLGITSNTRLMNLLNKYNIVKRQIRIKGERGYFFLIPADLIKRYVGVDLEEVTTEDMSFVDYLTGGGGDGRAEG